MSDLPAGPETPFDSFAGRLGKALKKNGPAPADEGAAPQQSDAPGVIGRAAQDAIQKQGSPPSEKSDSSGMIGRAAQDAIRNQTQPPGKSDSGGIIGRAAQDAIQNQVQPVKKQGPPNVIGRAAGDALKNAQPRGSQPQSGTNGTAPSDEGLSPFDSFARRLEGVKKKETETAEDRAAADATRPPESAGAVGGGAHVVKQGECVSSIAKNSGHFWKTIWEDVANAVLRETRKDPNVLLPGDRLHVPELRKKYEPGQTEKRHRFQRRGEPAVLRLTLRIDDVPLGNQPYQLEIDGQVVEGTTDPEGKLQQAIPPNARHGRLVVGAEQWEYKLELGHVDPVENLVGVQKRLMNLGFDCGRLDGQWDDRCTEATREFQMRQGLAQTGEPDDLTRQTLLKVHGS